MTELTMIDNPGFLKLDLVIRGMKISRESLDSPEIARALRLANETGAGLELDIVLPDDVVVNIPVLECLAEEKPYTLVKEGDGFSIRSESGEAVEVWLAPNPEYYDRTTTSGVPMVRIGRTYGGYLALSPNPLCEFIDDNLACHYCDLSARNHRAWTVDEVLETVEAALSEGVAEYICLNVGYTRTPDGGIVMLEPYIQAVKKRFDVQVCVQAQPPAVDHWIDSSYAMGIDSIAYNLEVYDPEKFEEIAPGKMQVVGRDRYFSALKHAAKIFPSGAVVSNLIIGSEPVASTMKGIDMLTALGVIPTLPIYRLGLSASTDASTAAETITPVYRHLSEALRRNRLSPTLISHFNLAFNAIEGEYFGGEAPIKGRWETVLRSKRGVRLAANLSRFRRRLRVRPVDDDLSEGH